jgi:hypothetical protein
VNHSTNSITWAYQISKNMFSEAPQSQALLGWAGNRLLSCFLSLNSKNFTWTVKVVKLHTCWVYVLRRTRSWRTVSAHFSSWTFISLATIRSFSFALSSLLVSFRRLYFPIFIRIFILLFRVIFWILAFT